ncbi:hypothetical protein BJ138DRAFT_1120526 [Hygrophoropsis aurantiaca]|uniref:Uncharacterized protein n=1 Tax=Hygrophoropsis aurantiaca TaxID=72124 RepID=A0ACB7ZR38_9AGAM|nr:hypothetical protein BJ138DRAFT_1120526 [Hygrophoropsis aurantiaca]
MLASHPELHQTVAEMSQVFLERWAVANVEDFRHGRGVLGWKSEGVSFKKPPYEKSSKNFHALPLVPAPSIPTVSRFVIDGRPRGVLDELLASPKHVAKSTLPSLADSVTWEEAYVPVHLPGPNTTAVHSTAPPRSSILITGANSNIPHGYPSGAVDIWGPDLVSPSHASSSKNKSVLVSPPVMTQRAFSLNTPSKLQPIRIFGPSTALALRELGLSDKLHRICFTVVEEFVPDRWAEQLIAAEPTLTDEMAQTIASAIWEDCDHSASD